MNIPVAWPELKSFVNDRNLSIQWLDIGGFYNLLVFDGVFSLSYRMLKTASPSSEQTDFEDNYKADGNKSPGMKIVGETGGLVGNTGDQLKTSDVLDSGGLDDIINVDNITPVEVKVGDNPLANRQELIIIPEDKIKFGFSQSTQNIPLLKNQTAVIAAGPNTHIWIISQSGSVNVFVGEIA